MTWANPPDVIVELRAMLIACAGAVSAGLVSGNVHFPYAVAESDDATSADAMPRAVLSETSHSRTRYAEMGTAALPNGQLIVTIDAEGSDVGQTEQLGRTIAAELAAQSTGLPITGTSVGLCSEESAGRRAADATTGDAKAAYRTITITVDWGLSP